MMKKLIFISGFLFSFFILFGCSAPADADADADVVKKGVLLSDTSLTVGEAFDSYKYFTSTSWRSNKTKRGRILVSFEGYIPQKGITLPSILKPRLGIIFFVDKDKTFGIDYIYIKWSIKNGDQIACPFLLNSFYGIINKRKIVAAIYDNKEILSSYFQKNELNKKALLISDDGSQKQIILKDGIPVPVNK